MEAQEGLALQAAPPLPLGRLSRILSLFLLHALQRRVLLGALQPRVLLGALQRRVLPAIVGKLSLHLKSN